MGPNLYSWLAAVSGLWLAVAPHPRRAPTCPPEAGTLAEAGWRAYRADSIEVAAERFTRADLLCDDNWEAKVGLGYTHLRAERVGKADSLFDLVVTRMPGNGDAWDGLVLTRWRRGDRDGALAAARRAIVLHPGNQTTTRILSQLDPDWNRQALGPKQRNPRLRVDARTRGDYFEVPDGRGWRRFYVNGVNMGVALPGKFPSEFPQDSLTYAGWLDTPWPFIGALLSVIVLYNKSLNDMVHVSRAYNGLPRLEEKAEVSAPRRTGLRRVRSAARFVPFHRAYHSVELTLLALVAAVVDTALGDLAATRVLVAALAVLGVVTIVGHLASILSSSRLR